MLCHLGATLKEEKAASKPLADAGKGEGWRTGNGTPEMMGGGGGSCLFCPRRGAQQGGRPGVTLTAVSSSLSSELLMTMLMSSVEGTGGC